MRISRLYLPDPLSEGATLRLDAAGALPGIPATWAMATKPTTMPTPRMTIGWKRSAAFFRRKLTSRS